MRSETEELVKMETPRLNADYASINAAGEYARQVIGNEEFREIVEDYDFNRPIFYETASDRVMIELAASVLNGEHPDLNPNISYDQKERITGEDFVKIANRLNGKPETGEEELSELKGSTQLREDEISDQRIRAIRNTFINPQFYCVNPKESREEYKIRLSFHSNENGETEISHLIEKGLTQDMKDRIEGLRDERNFEQWP